MGPRSAPVVAVDLGAGAGGWGRGRSSHGGSGGGEEAAAPAAGMRRQSTRGRSTGSGGGEESEAPAAAVHAGRISSEDAAAPRQNIRGGEGASKEEEKRSLRVWSDVFAGGRGGAKASSMMNEMAVTEGEQQITRNVVRKKCEGQGLLAGAGRLAFVHDADSAEARACQAALLAASVQGITEVEIETDSLILVSALKS
ncbi:uncharacterized protein LOC127779374 [Oryza glaberrima]|uniref:uncharacterized protein LOC127779374 n=1 Tax=Oryza glaberrima TaxID=4538 RepID=UPI00224C1A88|nr:uncharacterized protein LOC127779374 [Oryza glaberrima]